MATRYATRTALKSALGITDTADDTRIDAVLAAVSAQIDQWTNRTFHPRLRTLYFQGGSSRLLLGADLVAVTSIKTDTSGDRTYATTWAATDYDLEPVNAPYDSPPRPYTAIAIAPDGRYGFESTAHGLQIVGSWGYYNQRRTVAAALAEPLDASETGVDVVSGAAFEVGQTILIDSEQMEISAISSNTLTVTRGVNGTTAAEHLTGLGIDIYEYPVISEACLLQGARLFRRKDAPFGVTGTPEFGVLRLLSRLDPDVQQMLQPFKRWVVG